MQLTEKEIQAAEQLKSWMDAQTKERIERIAKESETTPGQMRQIAYKNRRCSPELAVRLDKSTRGELTMSQLCPDVIDWKHVKSKIGKRLGKHPSAA